MPRKTTLVLVGIALTALLGFLASASVASAAEEEKILFSFGGKDGGGPSASLIFDASGNLYGTTGGGGANNAGAVFELKLDSNGKWINEVLYSFQNNGHDGFDPQSTLILDAAGNLYGTTAEGGASGTGCFAGCGTVFELSPGMGGTWAETVLHSFGSDMDGNSPSASLIFDMNGSLYGTTRFGGAQQTGCSSHGCGIVFRLAPRQNGMWTETSLYSFCSASDCIDGAEPWAGLVFDASGNLYGTTYYGGTDQDPCGTVFKLVPGTNDIWTESVLHRFNRKFGCDPFGPLIFDADGNLYGTTSQGGKYGWGIAFELILGTEGNWKEKLIHRFGLSTDGSLPDTGLLLGPNGDLYGTTPVGGSSGNGHGGSGYGTFFKLTRKGKHNWKEYVLYNFNKNGKDGIYPAGLVRGPSGGLYGTTQAGGASGSGCYGSGCGTVLKVRP